jgi:cytochrome c
MAGQSTSQRQHDPDQCRRSAGDRCIACPSAHEMRSASDAWCPPAVSTAKQWHRRQSPQRRGFVRSSTVFLAAALATLATRADAQATRELLERSRRILEASCNRCHAIGKQGTSLHAQAPPFRNVVKKYAPQTLAEALAKGIVLGHPDMPELVFQPDEINTIVKYLDQLAPRRLPRNSKPLRLELTPAKLASLALA